MAFHQKVRNHEFVPLSITTNLRDTKKGKFTCPITARKYFTCKLAPEENKNRIFSIGLNGNVNGKMTSITEFYSFV